jgi:lactate dehydrogenase-like 2-hydroxyacid dehydrogenase
MSGGLDPAYPTEGPLLDVRVNYPGHHGHDSAAVMVCDGKVVAGIEEEATSLVSIYHLSKRREVLLARQELAKMKTSPILINTARGPMVDQAALIEALEQNRLAGAGLDVFDIQPALPSDHPILKVPNTVLAPHIGFDTAEAVRAKADIALRHLEDFLDGGSGRAKSSSPNAA